MTREEAISVLKETIDPNVDKSFKEWKEWDKEKHLPAVNMAIEALQAEPVRHGEWIDKQKPNIHYIPPYNCSECGGAGYGTDYCPNCGAKMDGGKND